ncbi:ribokinase [Tahibacter amnicola]|uniref:Ribokinase n=1 Tax=Tahibacter amnicola TaxID=2976241 RepID=A0ABY6BC27_9GAMM|nr:ribokinase [Tahibacter amnicola]UXI67594.1 ribokinase [Tahibacter amnicola]
MGTDRNEASDAAVQSGGVVVVGSYVQDHAWQVEQFPRPGETCRARGFATGPGGKGFNQAVACVRQGVPTAFIGAIGQDALGDVAQGFATAENLPCRWLRLADMPTAASSILVDASGQNQIAVNLSANERLNPDFIAAQADWFDAARVVLCQMENNLEAIAASFRLASQRPCLRILNPAPVHAGLDRSLLALVDILTPNETEFSLVHQRLGTAAVDPQALADMDDATLHALARKLDVPTVIITLGRHGCFVSHAEGAPLADAPCYRLAPEAVQTVDTTGAGDAFSGALAAALVLLRDQPFRNVVRHANRVAALSTEKMGTAPAMPRLDEVIARFGRSF